MERTRQASGSKTQRGNGQVASTGYGRHSGNTKKNRKKDSCLKTKILVSHEKPLAQQHPSFLILLAIKLFLEAWCSFRGAARALALFSELTGFQCPSYGSIRQWVYRLGYYCLTNAPLFDGKWVMILDHTVELGQEKCLVILGVALNTFQSGRYTLGHRDVRLLDMDIVTGSTGEMVHSKIKEVMERYGAPAQIVSDHGSDLKKGSELFCSQEPTTTVHTYDITHLIATTFKKELAGDERWEAMVKAATHTSKKVNQTVLHFLAPPKQRTKARFMNLGPLINWSQQALSYLKLQDFSEVGAGFYLTKQQTTHLKIYNSTHYLAKLPALAEVLYPTRDEFIAALRTCIGEEAFSKFGPLIIQEADQGKRKVEPVLEWLLEYKEDVKIYFELHQVARIVLAHVKRKGLGMETYRELHKIMTELPLQSTRAQAFRKTVLVAVGKEVIKIPLGETWLGCSDVIESLFGKYKQISTRSPIKTMGRLLLTLPLMTAPLTVDLVKQAMEKVSNSDLAQWANNCFGRSALAKRKEAFPKAQKVDELCPQLKPAF